MNTFRVAFYLTGILVLTTSIPSLATPPPDSDTCTRLALSYGYGIYKLENLSSAPPRRFSIFVSKNRIGHLQSNDLISRNKSHSNMLVKLDNGLISKWSERLSFRKKDKNIWITLSLSEAKNLWGTAKKRNIEGADFYTFDARSINYGETNIYHLDLKFNREGVVIAYRVRGIGISKPTWISEQWTPEKQDKNAN